MDEGNNQFVLPPTPEDYRRMWEAEHLQKQALAKRLTAEQAKRQAVKEILQSQAKKVTTPHPRYEDSFHITVNNALKG